MLGMKMLSKIHVVPDRHHLSEHVSYVSCVFYASCLCPFSSSSSFHWLRNLTPENTVRPMIVINVKILS